MKQTTKMLVEKYENLIKTLIPTATSVEFDVKLPRQRDWTPIGRAYEVDGVQKPNDYFNWQLGTYRVTIDGAVPVATWRLYQMPHCCAICVSCEASVTPQFRGRHLGTLFNDMRKDLSAYLGYSLLLCTDIETNEPQRKILAKNGWKDIYSVVNRRTGNRVYISVVNT